MSPDVVVGDNCILCEQSVIQPFAQIGNNVNVGSYSLVSHHAIIGDHCFIASGLVV